MPRFNQTSADRLATCRMELQDLFNEVVKGFDCSILCGHRSDEDQMKAFNEGKSKAKSGKHNKTPSMAVDVAPCPIDWTDLNRFYYFAGYVKARAEELGIKIRWGGDWDGDTITKDQNFNDLPHFELY